MSRDGLMPAAIDRVNAGGTPVVAHALSILAALVFILTGTFSSVLALAAFFFVANYLGCFVAIVAQAARVHHRVIPKIFPLALLLDGSLVDVK